MRVQSKLAKVGVCCGSAMRRAIYPGSFDPPTLGHLDIAQRSAKLFDEVIVAVGVNSNKPGFLAYDKRQAALEAILADLPNVRVMQFEGLLVNFAREQGASAIVRGLRAVSDFDYEFQIAIANRRLNPEIDTILLMTKWEYSYISSSVVREVFRLGGDVSSFVPSAVIPYL